MKKEIEKSNESKHLRNLGIIKVSTNYKITEEHVNFLSEIFRHVTPIDLIIDNTHYEVLYQKWLCYYPLFREIKEGEVYPEYNITIKIDENNVYKLDKVEELK